MWTFIKKLIPARIIIRSWYWVEIENDMEEELKDIFFMLDIEDYETAKAFIADFHKKYDVMKKPYWLHEMHSQICRAEGMLAVLSHPLIEEEHGK